MGRINVRQKGAAGEREVCDLLQPTVDAVAKACGVEAPRLHRNLMQASIGGEDIVGLPWYSIEVKRVEKLELAKWWEQAVVQAGRKSATATAFEELAEGGWRRLRGLPMPWAPPVGGWRPPAREAAAPGSPRDPQAGQDATRRLPIVVYRQNGSRAWRVLMEGVLPSLGGPLPAVVNVASGAFLHWLERDLRARLERLY